MKSAVSLKLIFAAAALSGYGAVGGQESPSALHVWDTGSSSKEPLAPSAIAARIGWSPVPFDKMSAPFKGDAVMTNGLILAVVRKLVSAVELYSVRSSGAIPRARLVLEGAGGELARSMEGVGLVESSMVTAALEVAWRTGKGSVVGARLRIKKGDSIVETLPLAGSDRLRVECSGRFIVLPDFFADDLLIDARKIPLSEARLPTDNLLLQMAGNGEAILMSVFENRDQEVRVTLAGEGEQRLLTGSAIEFGKDRKIWVAILESPGIWQAVDLKVDHAGKAVPLEWKMPFPAQWRVDFTGTTDFIDSVGRVDLTDSWEMLLAEKDGTYLKPSWMGSAEERLKADRNRMGQPYPCWTDLAGQGYVQPFERAAKKFVGPAVLYPIHRTRETPADVFTAVDVMRNSLGVGPCEYILDLEGQKQEKKGHATCGVRWFFDEYYGKGQHKEKRAEIDHLLDDGLAFVSHIRGRIVRYLELGRKMRIYLAEQAQAHPDLKAALEEFGKIAIEIENRVADKEAKMKTPDHVARMNADFRKNVLNYDGPDLRDRVHQYCEALVEIGENQDELVMTCRWIAKSLQQRAGMRMIQNPKFVPIAEEIRKRVREVLRNAATYEKARN